MALLAETAPANMVKLAERIGEKIAQLESYGTLNGIHVTISIGVAALHDDETPET